MHLQSLLIDSEHQDALRQAKAVCWCLRWVGGKDGREVEDYEINSALIEALSWMEKNFGNSSPDEG